MSVIKAVSAPISREKLLQIARALPADLSVLAQLGDMLQNFNSELADIAALLRRDVALAARIVRISNSALYGGNGEIASIEEAVNRVGFGEVLKLVGTGTAARLSERAVDSYGISAKELRGNMLFGAFAAEALARKAGADPRVAYTAGLVRPLGIMVLDRAGRGPVEGARPFDPAHWPAYSAWERHTFAQHHREVAAMILEEWRFPAEIVAAIRSHYVEQPKEHEVRLAVLINLSNGLALQVGRGFPGEAARWEITPDKLAGAGLEEEDLKPAAAAAETACSAAIAACSI